MERMQDADGAEIRIRDAEEEDRPRTRAIRWSAGWAEAPNQHRVWAEADPDAWIARRYYREFVAEVDGVIAARVGLEAYRPPFAEICDLSVRPEYRRRGLGRLLTRRCLAEAARRDFAAVFLQTETDNYAAHRLYTSLDFVPTALGKMLRMTRFINYPLLSDFRHAHPLAQYRCSPVEGKQRVWNMDWDAYVTDDFLRLRLAGGASQSDSEGLGPALTALDWRLHQGERGLFVEFTREETRDLEAGHYVELTIRAENRGRRAESGVFKMLLPPGVRVSSPHSHQARAFSWELAPGESLTQPLAVQIEPNFDADVLWHLNYDSLSLCMEAYWQGNRALLSASLPMAVPPPLE